MKPLVAFLLMISSIAFAQDQAEDLAAPASNPCSTEQHRQFDFWAGHWDVTTNGQPAGRNHIEIKHGGCALAENWNSAIGNFSGSSLNAYDQATDRWHQTWVDTSGTLLELNGGWVDGRMVMRGSRPGPDGSTVYHRITWTPNEDGSVRQHWESSDDEQTWATAFDGHYVKASAGE